MADDQFDREERAYTALQRVLKEAREAKELFEMASLPIPAPLSRVFGDGLLPDNGAPATATVPRLKPPPKPEGVEDGWISVPYAECMTITLAKAVMRESGGTLKPKAIVKRVLQIRPDLTSGGIFNVGPRLEKTGTITREKDGWTLIDASDAPIAHKGNVWGPPKVLQKQEVAWHRRAIILHLLNVYPGGLQVGQIVEQLHNFAQCKAPVSKDLLKADMGVLQAAKKAKRAGSSKKWVLVKVG